MSPSSVPYTVTATIAPVCKSTACSALWARRQRPSFIFAILASGSRRLAQFAFEVFFFRSAEDEVGRRLSYTVVGLVRNAGWNLAGTAIPVLTALVSIPILIRTIGDSRFGVLAMAWMFVGYLGLLDLGVGRAITYGVARRLAHPSDADVSALIWTGLTLLGIVGLMGGVTAFYLSEWLVSTVLDVPTELRDEAVRGLRILAIAVPVVVLSAGLRGAMEGKQAFRAINLVMVPLGALLYLGPVIVAQFSISLAAIMLVLLAVRVATCLSLFLLCVQTIAGFLSVKVRRSDARELLSFGGWMTVSNVVGPMMINMDRLFIGALMTVSAVTYYVTPFEVATKMLIVPGAIANASFPEFSMLSRFNSTGATRRYFLRTLALAAILLIPMATIVGILAHDLLRVWISLHLADESAGILRLLAAGIAINGLSYVPFAYVQGMGRSDVTAKFHLLELAAYVPALYFMTKWLGLWGVALAWVLRVSIDGLLLFGYVLMQLGSGGRRPGSHQAQGTAAGTELTQR